MLEAENSDRFPSGLRQSNGALILVAATVNAAMVRRHHWRPETVGIFQYAAESKR
jgi:hypothetical protein